MPKDDVRRFFRVLCALSDDDIKADVSVSFCSTIDLTAVEEIRAKAAALGGRKPSYTAFVVRAIAQALREFPYANRRVFRSPLGLAPSLHAFASIDVAVAAERAMPGYEFVAFMDVMRKAETKSIDEINEWLAALARSDEDNNRQWRDFSNLIRRVPWRLAAFILRLPVWIPSWWERYRGAAVLVSSPAKYGVGRVVATWAWPIGVSFGLVEPRAMVRDGAIVARPCFDLMLNFDRRVMAGAAAAKFFKRICELVESGGEDAPVISSSRGEAATPPAGERLGSGTSAGEIVQ